MDSEYIGKLFRKQLFEAFFNWLDVNRKTIGEHWYSQLYNEGKKAEAECITIMKIIGNSFWMFNMIAECGVMGGFGPNNYQIQKLAEGIDEAATKRLMALISYVLGLQGLPLEMLEQEIPLITAKHFSLATYVKEEIQ